MSLQKQSAAEHGYDAVEEIGHMRDAIIASDDIPDWFAEDIETTMDRLRWQTQQVEAGEFDD